MGIPYLFLFPGCALD